MPMIEMLPTVRNHDLFRFFGGNRFSRSLRSRLNTWKGRVHKLSTPRLLYQVVPIEQVSRASVQLDGTIQLKSHKLAKTLWHCHQAVCFLATLGPKIEKEIARLFKAKRMADAYVLDAVASSAVENLVNQFQKGFKHKAARKDNAVTVRFSPGYCDWGIKQQGHLFELLDTARIGVQLNESFLMQPEKSISGIFGISEIDLNYIPCHECRKDDCPERRAPYGKETQHAAA